MKTTVLVDQPSILRLLLAQGVDGKIKPHDPTRAGSFAMFPDINKYDTWYIVDLLDGIYTVTVIEGCTTEEAVTSLADYIRRFNNGRAINGRLSVLQVPLPKNN